MKEWLYAQFQNKFLWIPFILMFGSALYFTAPNEPNIIYALIALAAIIPFLFFHKTRIAAAGLFLFIFGFVFADGYTRLVNTPKILHGMHNSTITGIVTNIDYTDTRARVYLNVPANQINKKLSPNKAATIRVSIGDDLIAPKIGDAIDARVTLFKPGGPDAAGAFDYSRWAYFNGLSASGYLNEYNAPPIHNGDTKNINTLRDYIHGKTNSFLSDTLVLGYKNAVPKDDGPIWTATGVGHVWSISGFHMTLVGGWLFILFYAIFRSIPAITRNFPAKYPAIIFAWFGLLFYLFLSGLDVATIRAFLMTTLMFAAVLFSRNPISMRNVCIAFLIIYFLNPHYIMQPGFQLSFAAIFGLVYCLKDTEFKKLSIPRKIWRATRALILTSIIATIFTTPFVAYNFYSVPLYGLIGNLLLLTAFSIVIMPLVILGTITALFGIVSPLIWGGSVYDFLLGIANWIYKLPFSTIPTPHVSGIALSLIIFGFLCLMFIQNGAVKHLNKLLCAIFVSTGVAIVVFSPRPLFYTVSDNSLAGFVENDKLKFNQKTPYMYHFAFETWRQLNFEKPNPINEKYDCDRGMCKFKTENWNLVYAPRYVPLSKNIVKLCNDPDVDFIVSHFKVSAPKCHAKILNGGLTIYKSGRVKYTPTGRLWN